MPPRDDARRHSTRPAIPARIARLCLALALASTLALPGAAGADATITGRAEQRFLVQARDALRAGDAAAALRGYQAAYAANDESVEALVALGLFAERDDDPDQARANYERALEIDALRAIVTPGAPPPGEWAQAVAIAEARLAVLDGEPVRVVSVPADAAADLAEAAPAPVEPPANEVASMTPPPVPPAPAWKPQAPQATAAPTPEPLPEAMPEPATAEGVGVGLHLASASTPSQARAIGQALQESNADVLGRLGLHVAAEKRGQPANVSFRVMAGPVTDQAAAARVCGTLVARGLFCAQSPF